MNIAVHSRCSHPEQNGARRLIGRANRDFGMLAMLLWLTIVPKLIADDQQADNVNLLRLQASTVRILSGTDVSSGVIVSAEGHVLTVSHGLHKENDTVVLVLHDGAMIEANVLLRDTDADVAVLKIVENSALATLSPCAVSQNASAEIGQCVFSSGYPGRERNGLAPVIRLGELLVVEKELLRSSCTLTVGDSGGPLVNHKGELIGLHRQIGLGNESNLHLRIDQIRDTVVSVLDLKQLVTAASGDSAVLRACSLQPSAEILEDAERRTVEIRHDSNDKSPLALGTLLDSRHVATKLSELVPGTQILCRFSDQSSANAAISHRDTSLDLAILKLSEARPGIASLLPEPGSADTVDNSSRLPANDQWRLVFASQGLDSVSRAGIVTRVDHGEPAMVGKLGVQLEVLEQATMVGVREVASNGTVAKAGIQANDRIRALNGQTVSTLDDIAKALQQRQPGDWLEFHFLHEQKDCAAFAQLQHDPGEQFERTEFLDGRSGQVSDRRSGFRLVLQHDIPLTPHQCGGPLYDSAGRIIGVTIARRAIESSLAIPIETVLATFGSR